MGEDYFLETKLCIYIYVCEKKINTQSNIIENVFLCNFVLINGQNQSRYTN
jgi:hypothetical protein